MRPELRLLNLHFFNICRHHPTLKFKPHATDDERYVSGIDGVPLKKLRLDGDECLIYVIWRPIGMHACYLMYASMHLGPSSGREHTLI